MNLCYCLFVNLHLVDWHFVVFLNCFHYLLFRLLLIFDYFLHFVLVFLLLLHFLVHLLFQFLNYLLHFLMLFLLLLMFPYLLRKQLYQL